jgi:hypothetical protein
MPESITGKFLSIFRTRNSLEGWLFHWELPVPAHEQGIYQRNGYSAGNNQLIDKESNQEMVFCQELIAHGC